MKHAILAKGTYDYNAGNGSIGSGTPDSQTEAATEIIINRLAFIDKLATGELDRSTIVSTLPERKFLYENLVDEVIDWEAGVIDDGEGVYDFVSELFAYNCENLPYLPFYKHWERDKKSITNVNYNSEILETELTDFLVCIPRLKNSDTRRNVGQEYWQEFADVAKERFDQIFIFGKDNENLDNGKNIKYIDTLQDYTSYIHHESCKHIVSTVSGPCHYAQQFGNVNNQTKLTMIDTNNLIKTIGAGNPSYFDPCINFTGIEKMVLDYQPRPADLMEIIWAKE
tara:strand:- start:1784 stop:2632 length:849 start_codon:yes stop_codon:yes gene_type:complete